MDDSNTSADSITNNVPRNGRSCPLCGAPISRTQYLVYWRRPATIKCRQCRTELRYTIPVVWTVCLSILAGVILVLPLPFFIESQLALSIAGYGAYGIAVVLAVGYADAAYVQRKPPKPK